MRNSLERFVSGEVVVKLNSEKDVIIFFNSMNFIGFSSINENSIDEIKENVKNIETYIVEYIPGQGFMFDTLSNIRAITLDMFTDASEIITVNELFTQYKTIVA